MAFRHQRSVGVGLASVASALILFGCATPATPTRSGELALRIDPEASYALVGRFQLNAVEPWNPSRDIDFDRTTTHARLELPAGTFALALGAGARLVCAGEDPEAFAASAVPRLVSAAPQIISIAPGEVTTARISFGAPPHLVRHAAPDGAPALDAADPCADPVAIIEPVAAWR